MNVPVRNVYWLLLYAWNHLGAGETTLGAAEPRHLHDLFASVLADKVMHLITRGLDRGYVEVEDTLAGIRGRVDLDTTLRRGLLTTGRAHCRFDELRHDVPHNRILRATLRQLLSLPLDPEVKERVRKAHRAFPEVSDAPVSARDFRQVQLHRNNRVYDFALRVCRVIHENVIVEPGTGHAAFRDFRSDPRAMGALFEEFIRRFFKREQRRFRVSQPHVAWHGQKGTDEALRHLPRMRTDLVLRGPDRCIVVDTKFYANPLSEHFGRPRVRSGHLYQLLAYLHNLSAHHRNEPPYEGMLLYPVVDKHFSFDYRLNGFPVAVHSVDLAASWPEIRASLLSLLDARIGVDHAGRQQSDAMGAMMG